MRFTLGKLLRKIGACRLPVTAGDRERSPVTGYGYSTVVVHGIRESAVIANGILVSALPPAAAFSTVERRDVRFAVRGIPRGRTRYAGERGSGTWGTGRHATTDRTNVVSTAVILVLVTGLPTAPGRTTAVAIGAVRSAAIPVVVAILPYVGTTAVILVPGTVGTTGIGAASPVTVGSIWRTAALGVTRTRRTGVLSFRNGASRSSAVRLLGNGVVGVVASSPARCGT